MAEKKLSKQVTVGYDPMTGKRIRKRIYATSKTGLAQAEKDLIREYTLHGSPSTMTYKQYEDKFWDAYYAKLAPSSQKTRRCQLRKLEPLRNMVMSKITRPDLQKIINENWDHPTVCANVAMVMNQIWKSAVFDGVVEKNIAEGLKKPKKAKSVRRALTDEERQAIKVAEFDTMERFMVDILHQFGLRPGEAYALDQRAFDRKARTLTINKAVTYKNTKAVLKSTKTGVTRVLPVPDSFWDKIPKVKTLYFFVNDDGELLDSSDRARNDRYIVNKINVAMGGSSLIKATDMTLYTFRHNKASLLYYLPGISLKKKAEYMGHSEEMFLKTYSHMMEQYEDTEVLRQAVV